MTLPRASCLVAAILLAACAPAERRALVGPIAVGHRAVAADAATPPPPWHDPFFAGADSLAGVLERVRPGGELRPGAPLVGRDVALERRTREDLRAAGRRDVRTLFAFVTICRVAAPVPACADAILDAGREKAALDADALLERSAERGPAGERRRFSVAMLRMGEGPFRFDFRWDFTLERRDRGDGTVLVRYDLAPSPPPAEHVTVFRGAAVLRPDGDGTRWTEVLLVGSDLTAPFFLEARATAAVRDILARRWGRLAAGR